MATDGLIRKRQLAVPDSFNDTLSGAEISAIESAADHDGEFLEAILSQFKRIIHGDDIGNWNDDIVNVFGVDVSLKALKESAIALTQRFSVRNKNMVSEVTSSNGDLACGTGIGATPANNGYVRVFVDGLARVVGDGVKTTACYFSRDNGVNALPVSGIAMGDRLYWNGSIAGVQLDGTNIIEFDYIESDVTTINYVTAGGEELTAGGELVTAGV